MSFNPYATTRMTIRTYYNLYGKPPPKNDAKNNIISNADMIDKVKTGKDYLKYHNKHHYDMMNFSLK